MNPLLAAVVQPILKVLARAAVKAAYKLHTGVAHDTAEKYRAELAKAAKLLLIALTVATVSGCVAYKRAFVFVHDSIDEALQEQVATNSPTMKEAGK